MLSIDPFRHSDISIKLCTNMADVYLFILCDTDVCQIIEQSHDT